MIRSAHSCASLACAAITRNSTINLQIDRRSDGEYACRVMACAEVVVEVAGDGLFVERYQDATCRFRPKQNLIRIPNISRAVGAGWPCSIGCSIELCHCLAALGQAVRLVNEPQPQCVPRRHCFRSAVTANLKTSACSADRKQWHDSSQYSRMQSRPATSSASPMSGLANVTNPHSPHRRTDEA